MASVIGRSWWDSFLCVNDDGNGDGKDDSKDGGNGGGGGKPEWANEFGDTFDADKAYNLIKTLRSNERSLARAKKDLEDKSKEREDAEKSELQKLQEAHKTLTDELAGLKGAEKRRTVASAISAEAGKQGAIYPDDIFRLIDESDIDLTDEGKVKNAEKLVTNLKTARPALFGKAPGADGGPGRGNGGGSATGMNDLIRQAAGR